MGKIVLLDDLTINQIAAGEVIERPASAIKEVVENSIDAGAKNITVEIKNGGISYIRVTDDGKGIEPDDMEIAFERHATSKIRSANDLDTVKTMGFRGEALASIAAIAKVELVSKTPEADIGYKITVEGGDIIDKHEEGTPTGTSITIKDLFFNTPVRYKFLKKDFTESGYIEDAITRIAIANPGVAIKLINTGKTVIQTNGSGKVEDVVYAIYGKEISQNLISVDYVYDNIHVTGVIGKPSIARSNRSNQLFYVNNRYIKDKTLTSAADQGFKDVLSFGKHGFIILNLDMDPKMVDVNVHPTKLEVRFQDEQSVFKAVYHAIKEALLKSDNGELKQTEFKDMTPNDMLKEVKNKERIEAWSINKPKVSALDYRFPPKSEQHWDTPNDEKFRNQLNYEKVEEKKTENYATEIKELDNKADEFIKESKIPKPEFSEFKNVITDLDSNSREAFINEITKAKTSEEIAQGLERYTNILKGKIQTEGTKQIDEAKYDEHKEENEIIENSKTTTMPEEKNETIVEKNQEAKEELEDVKIDRSKLLEEYLKGYNKNKEEQKEEKVEEVKSEKIDIETPKIEETKTEEANNVPEEKQTEDAKENKIETGNTEEADKKEETTQNEDLSFEEMYKKLFGRNIEEAKKQYDEKKAEEAKDSIISPITNSEISLFEKEGEDNTPSYRFIGFAFENYIILTMNNELYILDQIAAREKIIYEKVRRNYYSSNKDSQLMLLPDVINLTTKEMGIFRDNKDLFLKAGILVDEFGDNTVKITQVPSFCIELNTEEIFMETLREINTVARIETREIESKFLATIAEKVAMKTDLALNGLEVDEIMRSLLKLDNPFVGSYGRPIAIKMSRADIEKKFSRR